MEQPLVSVIIPTHNRSKPLMEAIGSVLNQTYQNVEVVVVDDCGSDDTPEVVKALAATDPRVVYLRLERNQRANAARNRGFEISRGAYVNYLDSDDLFRPTKIATQVACLESNPDADACVCQIEIFHETPGDYGQAWNMLDGEHPLLRYAANDVVWGTAAPLWRRRALERVGPWDPNLRFHQDLDYHLRAVVEGVRFALIPDVLMDYRDSATGTITTGAEKRKTGTKVLIDIYETAERIARNRRIFDARLGRSFAVTYVWSAFVAARFRDWDTMWRAIGGARRTDPNVVRRWGMQVGMAILCPVFFVLGTGAKPAIEILMPLIGLRWHRWHFLHSLKEAEGKVYSGPIEYKPEFST